MSDSPVTHAPEPIAALPTSTTSPAPPSAPSIDTVPDAPTQSVASASSGAAVEVAADKPSEAPLPEKQHSQPGSQAPDGGATVGDQQASAAEPLSSAATEQQSGKLEEKKDAAAPEPSSSMSSGANTSSAPIVASAARVPTPSSRTSTPPLAHAKKKFSSVSVTKEFLSKAASPVPAPAKLVRPTAVAPPSQTTSKLLSTKLTTVPTSKTTTSPKPPASGATPASAPWASVKPAPADSSAPTLQHPAPTRGMGHMPNVAMGSGQGLGSAARRAWGPVGASERRGPPGGLSREFPTAKEVADGKRKAMISAQAIAQAEAAHNQAILADLNAFTHLEPNAHRWDEEDEDDDMIDFGDGRNYSGQSHAPEQHDAPVAKSERFGEDFDRSWPHKRDDLRGGRQDRVLFNPNEKRREPTHTLGLPTGTHRDVSREPPARGGHERALPPHLADSGRMLPPHMSAGSSPSTGHGPSERRASWRTGHSERDAPPHLSETRNIHRTEPPVRAPPSRPPPVPRAVPPHSLPTQAPQQAPPEPAKPAPPPIAAAPPPLPATAVAAPAAPVAPSGEMQAAEMHTAAEKARLRRLAEEAEREAAAERAREKARQLAERFGAPKTAASAPAAASAVAPVPAQAPAAPAPSSAPPPPPPGLSKPPHPPPGFAKPAPQVTIASRPRPEHGSPEATTGYLPAAHEPKAPTAADRASSWRRTEPLPEQPAPGVRTSSHGHDFGRRPSHGQDSTRQADRSELRRNTRDLPPHPTRDVPPHVQQRTFSSHGAQGQQQQQREGEPPRSPVRPKAPPGFEHQVQAARAAPGIHDHIASPHPSKREANFDTMLARIQAAMAKSRLSPPPDAKGSSPSSEDAKHSAEAVSTPVDATAPPAAAVSSDGPSAAETGAPTPASPKKVIKKAPPPPVTLPHLPPDYFDATQGEIARSPPPAWRLYTVKLPKVSVDKGSIPRGRLRAFESNRLQPHRGWAQTFDPPLDQYAQGRVLADVLVPQPIGRRFARQVETGPIVSISPRTLTKFQRKAKRQPEPRSLPGDALSFGPSTRPPAPETEPTAPVTQKAGQAAGVVVPPAQSEAPSASSSALPAGADAGAAGKPPAVRFMVSSELDGDSLLDEVNKMSLEHIGEGEDKTHVPGVTESSAANAATKPGTPPPPPAPRTNPTSPNTASGPWAKSTLAYPMTSPARDDPQREHLKSVWEQASESTHPNTATKAALSAPSAPASAPSQPDTPLYPTLNSPATAPDPASLKPASYGMGVGQFGARGQFGGYSSPFMGSGATSPDGVVGGMGVQYGIMGQGRNVAAANTNGFQQGLWAPSPGFPSALGAGGYYGGKDAQKGSPGFPNKEFGPDYRYNKSASQVQQAPPVQQVPQVQQVQAGFQGNYNYPQHHHAQQQFRGQTGVYGHVGYGHMGFGTAMAGPRNASAGRFPAGPANGEYQPQGYDQSYYSGQYHQHQQPHSQSQGQAFGQNGGSNGMEGRARKMW